MRQKKLKLLLVDWVDSAGSTGWRQTDELQPEIGECQSVGFLVSETKEALALALNRSRLPNFRPFGEIVSIPKRCIIRSRVLLTLARPEAGDD